jgi:hypothetical protein
VTVGYLTGGEALDVARLTGLKLTTVHHRSWEPADIDPNAVGAGHSCFLDLTRLSWWDRMRVAWVRIGGHMFAGYR